MIDVLGNRLVIKYAKCPFCGTLPSKYIQVGNFPYCITLRFSCDNCGCGKTKVLELDEVGKISLGAILDAFEKLKEEWNRRVE